jgi:hypothetical protein
MLREARERRQLTTSQLAAATRMKVQIVEAIESETFRKIPAPIYGRGFIKLYAEAVGLDPRPLIEEYMARVNQEAAIPTPSIAVGHSAPRPPAKPAASAPQPAPAPAPAPAAPPMRTVETWLEPDPAPPPVVPPPVVAAPRPDALRERAEAAAPVPEPPPPEPQPAATIPPVATVEAAEAPQPVPETPVPPAPPDEPRLPDAEPALPAPDEPERTTDPDDLFAYASRAASSRAESGPGGAGDDTRQEEPERDAPAQSSLPSQEPLFAQTGQRPPRTGFAVRPAPAAATRGAAPDENDEPPRLARERDALLQRTILVGVGVLVLAILLAVSISRCSAPSAKEVRRGPIKERLDLVVEPPPQYVR